MEDVAHLLEDALLARAARLPLLLELVDASFCRGSEALSQTLALNAFPANETLWQRYAEIRAEGLRAGDRGVAGTEFYRQNREAMDAGADVSWKERFNHDELSAVQHAMNLKLQDEAAFFAEYQNEPIVETEGEEMLTAEEIAASSRSVAETAKTMGGAANETVHACEHGKTEVDEAISGIRAARETASTSCPFSTANSPSARRPSFSGRSAAQRERKRSRGSTQNCKRERRRW